MDRSLLEKLYAAAPERAIHRALFSKPLNADCYGFLYEKARELSDRQAIELLGASLEAGLEPRPRAALRRLVELISEHARVDPEVPFPHVRELLHAADAVDPDAWRDDLVRPLMGIVQARQWYGYVSKVRGGTLFPDLIALLLRSRRHGAWSEEELGLIRGDERAPNADIVRAVELAHDDLGLADYAVDSIPVHLLLHLHRKHPSLLDVGKVAQAAQGRAALVSECFATATDVQLLPDSFAPIVAKRLLHCDDDEARILHSWLFSKVQDATLEFETAAHRLRGSILSPGSPGEPSLPFANAMHWAPLVGRHLTTGASWKNKGSDLIRFCIQAGRGFPPPVLEAALGAARGTDGATADEHRSAILRHVHDETARVLVELTEPAIDNDVSKAELYLSALMCLEHGSFLGGALSRLRKKPNFPTSLIDKLEACLQLTKLGKRQPTSETFIEAFRVLLGSA